MRNAEKADILVVGAGPAGLAATLALSRQGLSVICVDRSEISAQDTRTTALLQPSIRFLDDLGVWTALKDAATPLKVMRLIEAGGPERKARKTAPFKASEFQQDAFGENISATALRQVLADAVKKQTNAKLQAPRRLLDVTRRTDTAFATFADGGAVQAQLVIAADGRESAVRSSADIGVRRLEYGQSAIACMFRHLTPHENISTEIHRTGGPFTLVPHQKTEDDHYRSGLVWMMDHGAATELEALPDAEFERRATEWSLGVLGDLKLDSPRMRWPILTMLADRFYAKRLVLIAETAHVCPPIGAQGFNMSLKDVETLSMLISESKRMGRDIADDRTLATYEKQRRPEVAARLFGTAALNVAAIGAAKPIRDLRFGLLSAIYDAPPIRRLAMRLGLG